MSPREKLPYGKARGRGEELVPRLADFAKATLSKSYLLLEGKRSAFHARAE